MSDSNLATASDGRRQRSERSRQAIIDAMLDLIEAGNLVPTAQQVSDRAGVGIRSVFRHVNDMENLMAIAEMQTRAADEALFLGGNRQGTFEERLLHAVERHAEGFEKKTNVMLSARFQAWRYEILRKNYARYQRGLRKDLDDWLPELASLSKSRRDAVDAIASFEMWNRLREHQSLSKKQSIDVVVEMLQEMITVK